MNSSGLAMGIGQLHKYEIDGRSHITVDCSCGSLLQVPRRVGVYRCGLCNQPIAVEIRVLICGPSSGISGIITQDIPCAVLAPWASWLSAGRERAGLIAATAATERKD